MRRLGLYFVLFLLTISAATGVRASTDCEKWLTEYKNSLAHSPTAHRVNAAHRRLHHYIHRKLDAVKTPAPKPRLLPAKHTRPKMSRAELLRRLQLACGDLPIDLPDGGKLPLEPVPDFLADRSGDSVELASDTGMGLLPPVPPASYSSTYSSSPNYPGFPGGVPPFGGGGSGGGRTPTNPPPGGGGDQPPPGGGGTPTPVPEPESVVLFLTGVGGLAGVVRRKLSER